MSRGLSHDAGSSVWTENLTLGLEVALSLKSGACWVNSHNLFDAAAGFGGYRESGFGRDGGKEVRVRTCPGYWELKGLYKHVAQLERS